MKLKKLLALTLATALTMSMLSGCGSSATSGEAATEETSKEFSLWMSIHSDTAKYWNTLSDHPGAALVEEETGITVAYEHPPVGQEATQFNLLMAKPDTLPDAIRYYFNTNYDGGVSGGIDDGVLVDITTLVEENATNFMSYLESSDDLRRDAYNDDGQLVKFGAIIADEGMAGRSFLGPQINETYLEMTGLDVPVTIDDWTEMLYAFKDLGVTPFSFGCNNEFVEDSLADSFASAYGTTAGARYMNVDGVATFGPLEDGYEEWIELFRMWYEEGLLDADFLSKTTTEVRAEFESGKVAATVVHAVALTGLPTTSAQLGEEYTAVGVTYPVVNEGDVIELKNHTNNFNNSEVVVTTQAEDPIDIIEYLDYLYGTEAAAVAYWGTEGTSYDDVENTYYLDENGEKQWTATIMENPDGIDQTNAQRKLIFRDMNLVWDWESQQMQYNLPVQEVALEAWSLATTDHNMPSSLYLTADESNEYTALMTDIETYVNEMTAKFIMGIESMDNYDTFINTLYSMGIEEATEIQQAALDRYYAR